MLCDVLHRGYPETEWASVQRDLLAQLGVSESQAEAAGVDHAGAMVIKDEKEVMSVVDLEIEVRGQRRQCRMVASATGRPCSSGTL